VRLKGLGRLEKKNTMTSLGHVPHNMMTNWKYAQLERVIQSSNNAFILDDTVSKVTESKQYFMLDDLNAGYVVVTPILRALRQIVLSAGCRGSFSP
jgi:hypothetical protein